MHYLKKILLFIIPFALYSSQKLKFYKTPYSINSLNFINSQNTLRPILRKNHIQKKYGANKIVIAYDKNYNKYENRIKYGKNNKLIPVNKNHLQKIILLLNSKINLNDIYIYEKLNFKLFELIKSDKKILKKISNSSELESSFNSVMSEINTEMRLTTAINNFFKKASNMIWFLKWVTVEPTFPKQFFQGVLEKLLFENNIPLKILAKIGFKNLNIFFKINNAIIEDEESKNKAPSLYQKALERKKKLDEIKALSNMLQKSKYLGINHDANYISPLFKSGCGETVKFYLMIENNIIKSISFESSASMLTVKSIDLLCNICENKSIDDIKNYSEEYFLSLFNLALSGQRKQDAVGPFEVFKNWIKEIA